MRTFSPGNACAVVLGLVLVAGSPTWGAPNPAVGQAGLFSQPALELRAPPPPIPATGADGTWQRLDFPVAMSGHTATYDPVRERMVVFGGWEFRGSRRSSAWGLQLSGTPAWTQLSPTGTPPSARYLHSAIYDPVRGRMLIFGGYDGQYLNDLWELQLSGTPMWIQLSPAGTPPSARAGHSAIYDPVRDRMLVFGGGSDSSGYVWALDLSGTPTWSLIAPAGTAPSPRSGQVAIYDPGGDRMLVFGGSSGGSLNDLWELSLGGTPTWTQLVPASWNPPAPRYNHSGFYDPLRDRMVIFGGSVDAYTVLGDAWAFDLAGSQGWSQLSSGHSRTGHSSIYDAGRDRMVIFAGADDTHAVYTHYSQDVWALNLSPVTEWQELGPFKPGAREMHTAVLDPPRNRVLVFGGFSSTSVLDETWEFSLDAGPQWRMLAFDGDIPPARYGHTAIVEPVRDRMLVFGGYGADGAPPDDPASLWELELAGPPAWNLIQVPGTPPSPRSNHSAIYDPVRDRMVVFGGYYGQDLNDLWEFRLSGTPMWTQLSPTGTPPRARSGHSAIYDPVRDRMLVFGGHYDSLGWGLVLNDVWALSLSGTPAWSSISPSGTPPAARAWHTAVYDAGRDRMVVFGGCCFGSSYFNDAWELTLSDTPAWRQLTPSELPPPGRIFHAAVYEGARDRMLVFEGFGSDFLDDVWELAFSAPLAVGGRPNVGLALSLGRPNPTSGAVSFDLDLPSTRAVRASVCDVSGREVARLADRTLAPGRHRLEWNGRARSGARVPAGVYFLRVAAGEASLRRSVVVLR